MASSQQHLPRPSHKGRDFDRNLRFFLPSRHGTMDIDEDLAKSAAYSVDTATTTTSTASNMNGDTYSNGTALNSLPSFMDYPNRKPFVNSDYTRDPNKPLNSYPTTDRDAVLSALRNLQDKVKTLELERMAAEHNLETLASHTEQYKELVNSDRYSTTQKATAASSQPPSSLTRDHHYSSQSNGRVYINTQAKELDGQLSSAENRCKLLEKQLDYMKKLVDNSENDRRQLVEKTLKARKDPDIRLHLDRLNELERDQLRLNATQSLAETGKKEDSKAKIRELEDQMGEEKIYRKTLQGKTSELETACHEKKPFPSKTSTTSSPHPVSVKPAVPAVSKTKKPPKKKKKKAPPPTQRPVSHCKSEPTRHYRLNLAEIPFVAGKSTTPSHALGANVQKVLAMMKSHNAALCSQVNAGSEGQRSESPASSGSGSSSVMSSVDQDLTDLLNQLQEEFGQLSSDHQDLVQQLHGALDKGERLDLEQEIEVVVSRMEAKAQQIAKIRQHQNKYEEKKRTASKSLKSKRPHSAGGRLITTNNHHHHHNSHSHQNGNMPRPRGQVNGTTPAKMALGKPALFMLRDMKKLQTTLRRDDLCWD